MGNLVDMRAAARSRFEAAVLEDAVLSNLWAFCAELETLGVTWEVLEMRSDPIEVSIVIGGVGDPSVRAAAKGYEVAGAVAAAVDRIETPDDVADIVAEPVATAADDTAVAEAVEPEPVAKEAFVKGPWSDEEEARALDMIKDGAPNGKIAAALGRHAGGSNNKLRGLRSVAKEAVKKPVSRPAPRKRQLVPGKDRIPEQAPVATPEPSATATRPYAERSILSHLDAVGYVGDWNAERDLELVEELARGASISVVAVELQISVKAAKDRWALLNTGIGDLGHQQRLVSILRERANA